MIQQHTTFVIHYKIKTFFNHSLDNSKVSIVLYNTRFVAIIQSKLVKSVDVKFLVRFQNYCKFWPTDNKNITVREGATVFHSSTNEHQYYNIIKLYLRDSFNSSDQRTLHLIQFKEWSHLSLLPETVVGLITFWDEITTVSLGKHPVVVTC